MSKKVVVAAIVELLAVMAVWVAADATGPLKQPIAGNPGLVALDRAARANRYVFVFFYKVADQPTQLMGTVFNRALSRVAARADPIVVLTTNPSERGIVAKFGADRAPMPLVLVLAPNGAITGSFHTKFTEDQLLQAFAGPGEEQVLKALQEGKLVLLCVQNGNTKLNAEAMRGVAAFKADKRYDQATKVVRLDPGRADARPLLAKLGANFPIGQAVTFFLAPPGSIIGRYKGATDKNQLIATVTSAVSGCGASCKPGSCSVK